MWLIKYLNKTACLSNGAEEVTNFLNPCLTLSSYSITRPPTDFSAIATSSNGLATSHKGTAVGEATREGDEKGWM
jgi:hypothetical protein